jgi:hypothetical protein
MENLGKRLEFNPAIWNVQILFRTGAFDGRKTLMMI